MPIKSNLGGKRGSITSQKSSRKSVASKSPQLKTKKFQIEEFRKFSVKIEKKTC